MTETTPSPPCDHRFTTLIWGKHDRGTFGWVCPGGAQVRYAGGHVIEIPRQKPR